MKIPFQGLAIDRHQSTSLKLLYGSLRVASLSRSRSFFSRHFPSTSTQETMAPLRSVVALLLSLGAASAFAPVKNVVSKQSRYERLSSSRKHDFGGHAEIAICGEEPAALVVFFTWARHNWSAWSEVKAMPLMRTLRIVGI